MGEWKTIDTAPKDGTQIILIYAQETGECFVAWWGTDIVSGKHDWVIARAKDGTCFICKNPTHWMPLPPPPQAQEK